MIVLNLSSWITGLALHTGKDNNGSSDMQLLLSALLWLLLLTYCKPCIPESLTTPLHFLVKPGYWSLFVVILTEFALNLV